MTQHSYKCQLYEKTHHTRHAKFINSPISASKLYPMQMLCQTKCQANPDQSKPKSQIISSILIIKISAKRNFCQPVKLEF